jgi:ABC-type uncharacterized transport system fused permease/ATPase subunit
MDLSLWDVVRLRVSSLSKPKKSESTFLSQKPKLTKVVAYNDVLDYNSQSSHIFNQIKNQ